MPWKLGFYEPQSKVSLGTYRRMFGGIGGPSKEYARILIQDSFELQSKLLKGGYTGAYIGDYHRGS